MTRISRGFTVVSTLKDPTYGTYGRLTRTGGYPQAVHLPSTPQLGRAGIPDRALTRRCQGTTYHDSSVGYSFGSVYEEWRLSALIGTRSNSLPHLPS